MLRSGRKTTTYYTYYNQGPCDCKLYYVDAVECKGVIELWLYDDDHGIKMFCFGLPGSGLYSVEDALGMLENQLSEYIEEYQKEYVKA